MADYHVKVGEERKGKMEGRDKVGPVFTPSNGWWQVLAQYPDKGYISIQVRNEKGEPMGYTILKSDVTETGYGEPSKPETMEPFNLKGGARRRRRVTRRGRKSRRHTLRR